MRRSFSHFLPGLALAFVGVAAAEEAEVVPVDLATVEPADLGAAEPAATAGVDAAESDPDRIAQSLLNLGTSLADRGDHVAAEIAFRQILHDRTFSPARQADALLGLGRMFRRSGGFTKAAAIYEKFLKQFPDDPRAPDAMLELGRTHRAMGAPKAAIARFYAVINSTIKLPPRGFEHYQLLARTAQFEIAETHLDAGDYDAAGKFFARLRLLDLAPADRARAHFKSAFALRLAGDAETAAATLRSYLEQWPLDGHVPEARFLLATTLRELGQPQEALAVTLDLLRAGQDGSAADPRAWSYWRRRTGNQLANEFFTGGFTLEALEIYRALAGLAPEPAWRLPVQYQVALCYERLRQPAAARAAYAEIAAAGSARGLSPELTELVRMAGWRIEHLDWNGSTERQLTDFFTPAGPGRVEGAGPPAEAPRPDRDGRLGAAGRPDETDRLGAGLSPHDPDGSPATTPAAL
ncbi:MAG TPA: tetratricopeptide repeat protein [Opitutaceae bacterium]|nr:tetratricopeptide repeat protein [Opitutaceae bacterium]